MDRLSALESFVRVGELGSFSAAARDLGLTQPAVSQQIKGLERHLGVRLFDRTTRKLFLTEAGSRYLDYVRDLLERLQAADRLVGGDQSEMSGRLVISAPVGFGADVLSDYLIAFKRDYPEIILDLSLSDRFVDVIEERFDLAIRIGNLNDDRLIVRKLGEIGRGLAATPEYLDRRGRPETPEDLAAHAYLLLAHVVTGDHVILEGKDGSVRTVKVVPTLRSDSRTMIHDALIAGLGIGLIHMPFLAPMIEKGTVEPVLPGWCYPRQDVHVVYPSNRFVPPKVRLFVKGLIAYLDGLHILSGQEDPAR